MCLLLIACAVMKDRLFLRTDPWFTPDTYTLQTTGDTGYVYLCTTLGVWVCVFLPQLVPGSHRPVGVVTRGCGAPSPWAAWRRGSISESSADASPFSWCRTLPPPAEHWLKLQCQTIYLTRPCRVSDKCYLQERKSQMSIFKNCFKTSWTVCSSVPGLRFLVLSN